MLSWYEKTARVGYFGPVQYISIVYSGTGLCAEKGNLRELKYSYLEGKMSPRYPAKAYRSDQFLPVTSA